VTEILNSQVIDLNPHEVTDETLAALTEEAQTQADGDLNDIKSISKVVIDTNEDGGLDSHMTVITEADA
jgi:hypothetical protein